MIALRDMTPADIAACFEHQRDPVAHRMVAFAAKDADDRAAYTARHERYLAEGAITARMILLDGAVAGSIASWGPRDDRRISYWVWREHWGKGVATAALREFLKVETTRPLFGSAAADNVGSLRVMEKCGFKLLRRERAFASARGEEIEEAVLVLR